MQTPADRTLQFNRHAETLGKATALYVELRQLLQTAGVSAIQYDIEARRSLNRFSAVEYCADFEGAVNTARKRLAVRGNELMWDDFIHFMLNTAEVADIKIPIPAQHWRDLVSLFGRVLHERKLHPGQYFKRIKKRTPAL